MSKKMMISVGVVAGLVLLVALALNTNEGREMIETIRQLHGGGAK